MDKTPNKYHILLIYAVLALATIVAFEPVRHNEFVDYDDGVYVTENPNVTGGLTRESVIWAFTKPHSNMWHPLTTLSHMLDCELFGLNPLGHHLTSLLIHITNALLLFWLLKRMTGAVYPSIFVAAVFALHPLTVESVAWAAERKNVLSSLFWMLTIAAYIRYAERPSMGRYLLVMLALCLGLMAKPMVVTLPFVLILLDYWPLGRFQWNIQSTIEDSKRSESVKVVYPKSSAWRLIIEKIPLFVLVAVVSAITFIVQQSGGMVKSSEIYPLNVRIANALVSYISYIGKMVYSSRLAVFYPHPGDSLPLWQPIVCFIILAVVSIGIIYTAKRRRYLMVGWLWYLGTLVPVIGLVQTGNQSMADRYTYLPLIGIFIMVAWGIDELLAKWKSRKIALTITAAVVLVALSICTRIQTRYWQDSFTLYGHALEVTKNNQIMHNNYGTILIKQDRLDEAAVHFSKAIQISPDYAEAHGNLGLVFIKQGMLDEAVTHFTESLQINPDDVNVHCNLGAAFYKQGKLNEAVTHFRESLRIKPDFALAHYNLAQTLTDKGKLDEAVTHFTEALRINPDDAEAHSKLGVLFVKQGNFNEATTHFTEALRINPDFVDAHRNLGNIFLRQGELDKAVTYFEQAVQIEPNFADAHRNLGNIFLKQRDFDKAISHFKEALRIRPDWLGPMNSLGWLFATHPDPKLRNPNQAVNLSERAAELTKYQNVSILDTLAASYAAAGRFDQAVTTVQKAIDLAHTSHADKLADDIRKRLRLYKINKSYTDP